MSDIPAPNLNEAAALDEQHLPVDFVNDVDPSDEAVDVVNNQQPEADEEDD
jgi:hypothetical protein